MKLKQEEFNKCSKWKHRQETIATQSPENEGISHKPILIPGNQL